VNEPSPANQNGSAASGEVRGLSAKLWRWVFGAPKDVKDPHAFHKLSLVVLLAWVGLGADGLSSSAYGPDEAFRALGEHTGLAFFLALATAATVFIISYGYSRIIEQFPAGGGGYVVASRLLSPRVGVVSGAALLVDYVLTITISIASGADAIFSFLPPTLLVYKLPLAFAGVGLLTVMNIRGVKESVTALVPIFFLFVITHLIMLAVALGGNITQVGHVSAEVSHSIGRTATALGAVGALKLFVRAYSIGGGTYTGIEAVSNGVGMMREPRVQTAKRTMSLMASSLAITAGGILLAYLLVGARAEAGKTMNAVLLERVTEGWSVAGVAIGPAFVITALLSEGALLFVAAQAGFLDGPRVMANMAIDSWLPHRFAALSDRLSMRNGVALMSAAAFGALIYTHGDVGQLVVMYSINVFITFSLSNLAMTKFWLQNRREHALWRRYTFAHLGALVLCVTILIITICEKFVEGGWVTLLVTSCLVTLCFFIKRHYGLVVAALQKLDHDLVSPPEVEAERRESRENPQAPARTAAFESGKLRGLLEHHGPLDPDPQKPVAILLVGGYSGLGRHALSSLLRMFPNHFAGVVFVSVAVVDSESFKGEDQVAALERRTRRHLVYYERYAQCLGLRAASAFAVGTEVVVELEKISDGLIRRFPQALFVAGQLIFEDESLWNRLLHNETAFMVQKRLQRRGVSMIVVPVRLHLGEGRPVHANSLVAGADVGLQSVEPAQVVAAAGSVAAGGVAAGK
jgi:amino acid transporter